MAERVSWFKRIKGGITTSTKQKKGTPEGLWHKCPGCASIIPTADNEKNLWVCDSCNHHQRIGSREYFHILFDNGHFELFSENLTSADPLNFEDSKLYTDRLKQTIEKTKLKDAVRTAIGNVDGERMVVACMDFAFIGGSMGAVVGEKLARSVDKCMEEKVPLLIISKSGGARMMEAAFSLMQLAKTSAKLSQLANAKIPYISLLTDPTTGGVTASYAMLGDLNIAEPGALIGFAGPRVIKETIGKDLPKGFQTSEFVLEHGFLDMIVERKELKAKLAQVVRMLKN
ncbi:MAG: acetyl-CoA carboxylase carboxyltransferase subunit beta [Flavobacteriales bacterium]|nr:acetyl-CoA carboxylase carboxyltransferase subunit beta [Flavobacteriales bacterium]